MADKLACPETRTDRPTDRQTRTLRSRGRGQVWRAGCNAQEEERPMSGSRRLIARMRSRVGPIFIPFRVPRSAHYRASGRIRLAYTQLAASEKERDRCSPSNTSSSSTTITTAAAAAAKLAVRCGLRLLLLANQFGEKCKKQLAPNEASPSQQHARTHSRGNLRRLVFTTSVFSAGSQPRRCAPFISRR